MTEKEKQFNQWFDEYADGVKVFEEADMKRAYLQGRSELEKENAELKSIADFQTSSNMDRYFQMKRSKDQLTKAKEIIREFVDWATWQGSNCPSFKSIQDKAEQFLKGEFITEPSNECHDCAKFDEMPKGSRCKTCDNGSRFQKKEGA